MSPAGAAGSICFNSVLVCLWVCTLVCVFLHFNNKLCLFLPYYFCFSFPVLAWFPVFRFVFLRISWSCECSEIFVNKQGLSAFTVCIQTNVAVLAPLVCVFLFINLMDRKTSYFVCSCHLKGYERCPWILNNTWAQRRYHLKKWMEVAYIIGELCSFSSSPSFMRPFIF